MAVQYVIYQNHNKSNETAYGKYYARAVHDETVDIDDLADQIEANVSVKRSDVLGVIAELIEVMTLALQAGKKVKLNRFGTFKIGLTSKGVENVEDFTSNDIVGSHILFRPYTTISTDGTYTRTFLTGVTTKARSVYTLPEDETGSSTDSTSESDDSDDEL